MNTNNRIILRGGTLVHNGSKTVADVAILNGRIECIAPSIEATDNDRVFDCTGKIITPGLVDLDRKSVV